MKTWPTKEITIAVLGIIAMFLALGVSVTPAPDGAEVNNVEFDSLGAFLLYRYQSLIAAGGALIGASMVVLVTLARIRAARGEERLKDFNERIAVAAALAADLAYYSKALASVSTAVEKETVKPADLEGIFGAWEVDMILRGNVDKLGLLGTYVAPFVVNAYRRISALAHQKFQNVGATALIADVNDLRFRVYATGQFLMHFSKLSEEHYIAPTYVPKVPWVVAEDAFVKCRPFADTIHDLPFIEWPDDVLQSYGSTGTPPNIDG